MLPSFKKKKPIKIKEEIIQDSPRNSKIDSDSSKSII